MMRSVRATILRLSLLGALSVSAVGCAGGSDATVPPESVPPSGGSGSGASGEAPASDPDLSLLYSVVASRLEIVGDGVGFSVILPADSNVAWFSDRPERRAGTMTLSQLVAMWSTQGFDEVPPNAALVVARGATERQHVVELSDPVLEGSDIVMRAVALDEADGEDTIGRAHVHDIRPGRYRRAELFIDSANLPPCPSSMVGYEFVQCVATGSFSAAVPPAEKGVNDEQIDVSWWMCSTEGAVTVVAKPKIQVSACPTDESEPTGAIGLGTKQTFTVPAGRAVVFWGHW